MPKRGFAGGARPTTTTDGVSEDGDFFHIASTQGWFFNGLPFVVVLDRGTPDEEKVLCSGIVDDAIIIEQRGYDDTDPVAHAPGAPVRHVLDSETVEEANAHANETTADVHPQYLMADEQAPSSHRHVQGVASAEWVIVHNLGFRPGVSIVDSAGRLVVGDVTHNSVNQLTVTFASGFSGEAYLS